ncbi:MAG TPA: hypothetical protein VFH89_09520 [Sphingomicrobium sp.]|nr:hypothetical protein [Sphingomicrobium sp.]
MSRIPTHSIEDSPAKSRPLLQKIAQSTPGGRPANLHAQMAHSPAVLTAYTSLRAVLTEQGGFDPKMGAALTLAAAAGVGNDYMIRIAKRLASMNGWADHEIDAVMSGSASGDTKMDALAGLVREAAGHSGNVSDATWNAALAAGWTVEQLADAFVYVGATTFTGYFLNFAQTEVDV